LARGDFPKSPFAAIPKALHTKDCKYLKNAGKSITIINAMKQGYALCNVCKAPKLKRE
jgi:hypothetical protein